MLNEGDLKRMKEDAEADMERVSARWQSNEADLDADAISELVENVYLLVAEVRRLQAKDEDREIEASERDFAGDD